MAKKRPAATPAFSNVESRQREFGDKVAQLLSKALDPTTVSHIVSELMDLDDENGSPTGQPISPSELLELRFIADKLNHLLHDSIDGDDDYDFPEHALEEDDEDDSEE